MTSTTPVASPDTSAIGTFCDAQMRLKVLEERFATQQQPLHNQLVALKDQIRKKLEESHLTCVPVQIGLDSGTPAPWFVRLRHSETMGALKLEGLEQSVQELKEQDLETAQSELEVKLVKNLSARKRKREPIQVPLLAVWEQAIKNALRDHHLKSSDSVQWTHVPERNWQKLTPAPAALVTWLEKTMLPQWQTLKKQLDKIKAGRNSAVAQHQATLDQIQPQVLSYLQTHCPTDLEQNVGLDVRGQQTAFVVRQKERVRTVPVRITTFRPVLQQTLQSVLPGDRPCSLAESLKYKQSILEKLTAAFQTLQTTETKVYVALDKEPVRTKGQANSVSNPHSVKHAGAR